jgi:hypothetical protein
MKPHPKPLNIYGDIGRYGTEAFGVNISAERLDWLDLQALDYVVQHAEAAPRGLDLGCGLATPSLAFAIAGAHMHLIDIEDLSRRFRVLAGQIPISGMRFSRCDLNEIEGRELWDTYEFCYSQRTIHYLRFSSAVRLLRLVASRLRSRAPLWLSASGIESELGEGYACGHFPLEERFCALAPRMAEKHQIFAPLCLYSEADLVALAKSAGFTAVEVKKSEFGNIKARLELWPEFSSLAPPIST